MRAGLCRLCYELGDTKHGQVKADVGGPRKHHDINALEGEFGSRVVQDLLQHGLATPL